MNGEAMRETLRVTKALADIQRIRILMMLQHGELCVCRIVAVLGLAPSTVSKHLSLLAGAGLVDVRKEGRWSYYRLPDTMATDSTVRSAIDLLKHALCADVQILNDLKKLNKVTTCSPEDLCRRQRGAGGVSGEICGALGEPALPGGGSGAIGVACGVLGDHALPREKTDEDGRPDDVGGKKVGRDLRARRSLAQRKSLPHAVPAWVSPSACFFVTINCRQRGANTLCHETIAQALLTSARHYEETGRWYLWLILLMPDHVHLIGSFNPDKGLRAVVAEWKRYQARQHGITWQANFFDHRLRDENEFNEKAHYIRMNPVRKELADSKESWPFVMDRTSGALGEPALPAGGGALGVAFGALGDHAVPFGGARPEG